MMGSMDAIFMVRFSFPNTPTPDVRTWLMAGVILTPDCAGYREY
jgi:hypothetical protein